MWELKSALTPLIWNVPQGYFILDRQLAKKIISTFFNFSHFLASFIGWDLLSSASGCSSCCICLYPFPGINWIWCNITQEKCLLFFFLKKSTNDDLIVLTVLTSLHGEVMVKWLKHAGKNLLWLSLERGRVMEREMVEVKKKISKYIKPWDKRMLLSQTTREEMLELGRVDFEVTLKLCRWEQASCSPCYVRARFNSDGGSSFPRPHSPPLSLSAPALSGQQLAPKVAFVHCSLLCESCFRMQSLYHSGRK